MTDSFSLLHVPSADQMKGRSAGMVTQVAGAVAFFAVYLALDKISYLDAPRPFAVMAWNPALGVCVAIVSLWGRKSLPLVFAAPLLAAVTIRGFPLTPLYTICAALLGTIKVASTVWCGERLAAVASNVLLRSRQAAMLLVAIPITLLLDALNAEGLSLAHFLSAQRVVDTTERLWIGDLIGIFVQTPFCLLALTFARTRFTISAAWIAEVLLQSLLVGLMVWFTFGVHRLDASEYFYLLFLPMIWIVLNHGLNGAIVLNMLVQASTISYLLITGPAQMDLIFFQALAIVLVVSSLTLGLSVEQSRAATQRLRAREQEVAASLKIAATSELAGALAHELSHPIGAVSNYAAALGQILSRQPHADPALNAIATKLRNEARRATDTVRRLREFFRSGSLAMEPIDLSDLVRDAIALLTNRIGSLSIVVRTSLEPGIGTILADRIQLLGVLHNLLLNAIEAMETVLIERRVIAVSTSRDTDFISVSIEDSGPGIAPDIRDHMFEALATTKSAGLGLGLSISRSVVQAHGGRIALAESELGGAKFIVRLPLEKP